MARRAFRLERLLRVTRMREEQYLLEVALARRAERLARDELQASRDRRTRLVAALRQAAAAPDPLEMTLGTAALEGAEEQVRAGQRRVREREWLTAERLVDLIEAARGRKSLEHLRQRHLAEIEQELRRAQAREADEHAQRRAEEGRRQL